MMFKMLGNVLPYVGLAVALMWTFQLSGELAEVEMANESLTNAIMEYASVSERTDLMLSEWADAKKSLLERRNSLNEGLDLHSDTDWDSFALPDEYVRLLREAGIYDGSAEAAGSACPRGGASKASGSD